MMQEGIFKMQKIKVHSGDWVVVCDGRKALILENRGDEKFPNLHTKEAFEHADLPTHVQGASAPGRVHQSMGTARSTVEQTDWHDEAERAFLHSLANKLDRALKIGETKALIIAAPPRALGMLRQIYTPLIRHALRSEIDKDFVKLPVYEIEKRLFS